jgi:TolB-like protein/Tfp pilus assembly protein PilF
MGPNLIRLLEQVSSRAGPAPIESIAVLPLQNLSGDPEQEYFADGMTEALITDLAKIGALKVISRSSVMRYKETDKPLAEIARELNVDALVEGSALRFDGSVRIMAQLIDPKTEQALWADSYEQELENVLLLWSEVAQAIAGEVQVALTPDETKRLAGARPVNPEAHDAYLKGSYHWKKLTREDLDTAQQYFDLALEKDPSYALAYAGLANVWAARHQMSITHPHETGPKAKAAALQAIALDDSSAGAHSSLAGVRTWTDWDWAGAEPEWRRALELDPNFAEAHAYFAHFLAITGRVDEAIPHSKRALEIDPFNVTFHVMYGHILHNARRYDEAITAIRTALAMQPNMSYARIMLRRILFAKGMRDEFLDEEREQIAHDPEFMNVFEQGLAEYGQEGAFRLLADAMAARLEEVGGVAGPDFSPQRIANRYVYAGDYDRAMELLEKAYEMHHPALPYISAFPIWDPLRSDPRFQDLLRRMNLPTSNAGSDPDQQ